ncbi:glycosyltransferase family 8 protein [Glaciimonas soli]|uniref:UDP-glucose--(Glucosyl) LPS alpha 1,3-glucosyltransferase WaaO n=1 Tax=Glaciimonas soli TaxID=2590999 RepID=A0A843YL75_9BURK|nr:glycosyltransferase [Glaciimonas soli]MQR00165.1 UDP-glucose--(glucosyl) LPS alpha 1,3-glucosyltransferase WaaO [Glaciimonas soli]
MSSPVLHVAFGADGDYFLGMGVAIVSVLENNRNVSFIFHVFTPAMTEENQRKLREIEATYQTVIDVKIIDPSIFNEFADFPSIGQYSPSIFTRLVIPAALQGVTDKVLYLDADIICQGSIEGLQSIDIDDCILAAVAEAGDIVGEQIEQLHLQHGHYFNSGVLYINVKNWIANDVWQESVKTILASEKKFCFPDQDALNIVLDGQVKFLPSIYNLMYDLFFETKTDRRIAQEVVCIHFVGRLKPWHTWCCNSANQVFLKYKALSPWADAPLYPPKNYKEMRMYAQGLNKTGHQLQSLKWSLRYLWNKYFR